MPGKISRAREKGKRRSQEDRYGIYPVRLALRNKSGNKIAGMLLAVMDGHLGEEVAEFCRDTITKMSVWCHFSLTATDMLACITSMLGELTREMQSGTTISLAFIPSECSGVAVAVIGDSPVMILDRHGNMVVSPSHNVRVNKQERKAAEARGGIYDDGYIWLLTPGGSREPGFLQMSRALGDKWMGDIILREAEIYTVPIGPKSVVALVTDGVIDPAHSDIERERECASLVWSGANAHEIMRWAKGPDGNGLRDNATAIVWRGPGWDKPG